MQVFVASPRGFCAGVVRAIDIVEIALKRFGAPVYVKHQIVHNQFVVESLEVKGAVTVDDIDEVPMGSVVVFSAHGSPPMDYTKASFRGLKVIDATCPLVSKVHNEARKYSNENKKIILIGHKGHQEVQGTMGQTDMKLIDEREGTNLPDWDSNSSVVVLTQTTLSVADTESTIKEISKRFPNVNVRNDICYATTNRQRAVQDLVAKVDLLLVIGSQTSSNCNRLTEVARQFGVISYLINGPYEIRPEWLSSFNRIGITSGASTPEELVQTVIEALSPDKVTALKGVIEDITFVLPQEIR